MWTEIFVTHDDDIVKEIINKLKFNNIISKIIRLEEATRILVPYTEVSEALDLIIDLEI